MMTFVLCECNLNKLKKKQPSTGKLTILQFYFSKTIFFSTPKKSGN